MSLPLDPFGRSRLPADADRRERVRRLLEVARALVEGREPDRAAALFVGAALEAYLRRGGKLERDYLRITPPRGSNLTAQEVARRLG